MNEFDYRRVDLSIHSPVRLAIMTALVAVEEVDFNFLKKKLELTDGNLSSHMAKLEEKGYVKITKSFRGKKPHTSFAVTPKGRRAFEEYVANLEKIVRSR